MGQGTEKIAISVPVLRERHRLLAVKKGDCIT